MSEIVSDPAAAVGARAENLFLTRNYYCTESVLLAINQSLGGGLTEEQAVALGAGFTIGIGGSGCLCGAISGGVMALGLFIGGRHPHLHRKKIRQAAETLHKRWMEAHKSSCCRVLTKNVKDQRQEHFRQCAAFTGEAARLTAELLLELRPELADRLDADYAARKDTFLSIHFRRLINKFKKFI